MEILYDEDGYPVGILIATLILSRKKKHRGLKKETHTNIKTLTNIWRDELPNCIMWYMKDFLTWFTPMCKDVPYKVNYPLVVYDKHIAKYRSQTNLLDGLKLYVRQWFLYNK